MLAHIAVLALITLKSAYGLDNLKLKGPATIPADASSRLHPALASFSIETAFFQDFFGNTTNPNQLSLNLLSHLKDRTGIAPEIRIGGITADSTYWKPEQNAALVNFVDSTGALHNTTIGPEFWKIIQLLPDSTKITMNLDLHDLDYQGALSMAQATLKGLKRDQLATFEIGNEPDHYLSFTPANYTAIWSKWAKDISTALQIPGPRWQVAATAEDPLWPYGTATANSQLGCASALAAGANKDNIVKYCSEHTYQYSVCDPPRIRVATLPNLVNHTRLAMYLDLWQPRIKTVRQQLGDDSFLIGEYNSVSCSGKDGVSNTFGQALWLLDTTFYAASINVSRLYIHQGGPLALQSSTQLNHGGLSFYDMWYPVQNTNGPIQVFPSYHTYLFIAEALGYSKTLHISNIYPGRQSNGSTITTALGDQSAGQLVVYGFWDESDKTHPAKLALLNMQIWNETMTGQRPATQFDISNHLTSKNASYIVRRLQAPGADVKDGTKVTWAGQTYSGLATAGGLPDGTARGDYKEEHATGGVITVAASEAVLVIQGSDLHDSSSVNASSNSSHSSKNSSELVKGGNFIWGLLGVLLFYGWTMI
ncbi:hypothetical protein CPB83DRAFT_625886 [Crepidotus variabilis]|uniref:Beta-glucuronidase C-terminal domain-containing protein n=1 Tax=Crepidotus variabilis TaxID=179855 RepID=A0A9P6ENN5_9AGAR|nr:hypothetical protein CPB83DRAFT_625886 [Crepidotus variabilis]